MAGVGGIWCARCGCDIEGGGGRGKWEEEEEEESEESSMDESHSFLAVSDIYLKLHNKI